MKRVAVSPEIYNHFQRTQQLVTQSLCDGLHAHIRDAIATYRPRCRIQQGPRKPSSRISQDDRYSRVSRDCAKKRVLAEVHKV